MELAIAKPALMAAQEAVNCLDKPSLTELKSFSKVRRGAGSACSRTLSPLGGPRLTGAVDEPGRSSTIVPVK